MPLSDQDKRRILEERDERFKVRAQRPDGGKSLTYEKLKIRKKRTKQAVIFSGVFLGVLIVVFGVFTIINYLKSNSIKFALIGTEDDQMFVTIISPNPDTISPQRLAVGLRQEYQNDISQWNDVVVYVFDNKEAPQLVIESLNASGTKNTAETTNINAEVNPDLIARYEKNLNLGQEDVEIYAKDINADVKQTITFNKTTSTSASILTTPIISSITVTATSPSSLDVGSKEKFTATGNNWIGPPEDVSYLVTWFSDNTAVATIDTSGLVTAVGVGTTNITAMLSGITSPAVSLTVVSAFSSFEAGAKSDFVCLNGSAFGLAGSINYVNLVRTNDSIILCIYEAGPGLVKIWPVGPDIWLPNNEKPQSYKAKDS
jgi:hypothetical protein